MTTVRKLRRALGLETTRTTRSKRPLRPSLEGLERREVMTIAFNPALGGETVSWQNNIVGSAVTGPVTNSAALNNPTVYLIFSGSSWTQSTVNWDDLLVNDILSSDYLSGLTQYGSSGTARLGGSVIDNRPTAGPFNRDAEIQYALDVLKPSWQKPTGVAPNPGGSNLGASAYRSSPIYVVIDDTVTVGATNDGGSYYHNGTQYLTNTININSGIAQNTLTTEFSQQLVDRMTNATGMGIGMNAPVDVSGRAHNAGIADNEPAVGNYSAMIDGLAMVTAYWSVVDQQFIAPDSSEQKITLQPIWNGKTFTGQFDLFAAENAPRDSVPTTEPMNAAKTTLVLGTEGAVFSPGEIRNVTIAALATTWNSSQVWQYNGPGTGWTLSTPASMYVDQLTSNGHEFFARSSSRVWMDWYGSWDAITGMNTKVYQLATSGINVDMLATNGGPSQIWQYTFFGTNWTPLTSTSTNVSILASANNGLFMFGGPGGKGEVWEYSGSGTAWTMVTGTNTNVSQLVSTGNSLYMLANNGGVNQVWKYAGLSQNWTPVTSASEDVFQLLACGGSLIMYANRGSGFAQVWRYDNFGTSWTVLTDLTMNVTSIGTKGDMLYVVVPNPPSTTQYWSYTNSGTKWKREV